MAIKTSKMKVINPARWGYRKVNIFYGVVRPAEDQQWALAGDMIQNLDDGSIWEFQYREGEKLRGYPIKGPGRRVQ